MAVNYQVKQGDCIFSIAFENGFFADTIWNHPNNAELKKKREDPHILLPGDVVYIPELRIKEVSEPTNQVHKFRCKNTPKILRIQFMGFDAPLANLEYKMDIDGKETEGKTDGEGWLKQAISPNAKLAKLVLADGSKYELKLGNLDPVDEVTGLQGRLHSLGLYEGRIDGKMNDETKGALRDFQHSHDLEATGEADAQTKDLLVQMIGE
jgi:N-acetylmuramoyl-L-alanine amidase